MCTLLHTYTHYAWCILLLDIPRLWNSISTHERKTFSSSKRRQITFACRMMTDLRQITRGHAVCLRKRKDVPTRGFLRLFTPGIPVARGLFPSAATKEISTRYVSDTLRWLFRRAIVLVLARSKIIIALVRIADRCINGYSTADCGADWRCGTWATFRFAIPCDIQKRRNARN